MDKLGNVIERQLNEIYYNPNELKHGNKAKTFLSSFDVGALVKRMAEILKSDKDERFVEHDLFAWDSKLLFYLLLKDLVSVLEASNQLVFSLDLDDFLLNARKDSTVYSEIEGSLSIEGVPTTRKRMTELLQKGAEPTCRNDTIIKNMSLGLKFISERPLFNEGNLASLYEILSKGCLDEEDRLKEGETYCYDEVEADQYFGCPHSEIRQCMDSLFAFVNANLDNAKLRPFLP